MKLIFIAYLLVALFSGPLRRWHGAVLARTAHALILWKWSHRPWRVAWDIAKRRWP